LELYFASTVIRVDLETENHSDFILKMLMESDPNVQSYIIGYDKKGAELASIWFKEVLGTYSYGSSGV
jgi:hypothetical protein